MSAAEASVTAEAEAEAAKARVVAGGRALVALMCAVASTAGGEQRAAEAQTHTGTPAGTLAGAQRRTRDSHLDSPDLRDLPVHFLRRHVREGRQQPTRTQPWSERC